VMSSPWSSNICQEEIIHRQAEIYSPTTTKATFLSFDHSSLKMLYLVGLGLSDETDITVKGLAVVKSAARVYLEAYTSILLVDKEVLVRNVLRRGT
jgi:hypothetical protein